MVIIDCQKYKHFDTRFWLLQDVTEDKTKSLFSYRDGCKPFILRTVKLKVRLRVQALLNHNIIFSIGHYCDQLNMTSPGGLCEQGYYCKYVNVFFHLRISIGHVHTHVVLQDIILPPPPESDLT